jgi:hypothetical protein
MDRHLEQGFAASTFASRKQDYLANNGEGLGLDEEQKIWAWFENGLGYNGNKSKSAQIDAVINRWFGGSPTDPEDSGWTSSHGVSRLHLIRVLRQYPHCVSPADLRRIQNQFHDMVYSGNGSDIWNCGSSNGVVARKAAAFIYLEDHNDATVIWPSLPNYCQGNFNGATSFVYGGSRYQDQRRYNALAIVRDWLYSTFDRWVAAGDWTGEFDAFYTSPLIYALYTLYDFAQDATMKRKAKMMLDMLLLDCIVNVSSNNNGEAMHGGIPGRTYGNQMLGKSEPWIFWYPLWGLTRSGYKHPWHTFACIYVSEYAEAFSSERIIEDIGCLSGEPDDYSHVATEYHQGGGNRGKWTFVTKNYSLGCALAAGNNRWIINVLSRSDRSGSGMRIWIDRHPQIPGPDGGEYYLEYGESGHQFQNAILAFGDNGSKYLHFADYDRDDVAGNSFDVDETAGGWRFLRKDDAGASVAMAVKMGTHAHAIEMCLIGLDYPSYDDFKSAVQRNASIHDNEYGTFTTSKGRQIGREYDQTTQRYYTLVDGKRVFPDGTPDSGQLATRLQCVDHRGDKIIAWSNNVMTIAKNGQTATYDFNDWTCTLGGEAPLKPDVVDTPTISPYGGTFTGEATVELRTTTSAAELYYTTDGSTPSLQSTPYTGPFQLMASATVKVRGFKPGLTASNMVEAYFAIDPAEKVATPTINPNSGISADPIAVTLATATEEAEIYYTLGGATPSPESTPYSMPFAVSATATVRAKAFKADMAESGMATAKFIIGPVQQPAEIIIDDNDAQAVYDGYAWEQVTHLDDSLGGRAHWHWNNSGASVVWHFDLLEAGMYEVFAWWGDGYGGLGVQTPYVINHADGVTTVYRNQNEAPGQWHSLGQYKFNAGEDGYVKMLDECGNTDRFVVADAIKLVRLGGATPKAATPIISPAGGVYGEAVAVTLYTGTPEAEIYYTTDGTLPTPESTLYTAPLVLDHSATVRAKAFKAGLLESETAIANFMIGVEVQPVEIILDDDDARVVLDGYAWEEVKHINDSFGGRTHWHWNNSGASAIWRPEVSQPGYYEVFAWWGDGYGGLGSNVPYVIHHAEGFDTVYRDQNDEPGQWHSLGVYNFNAGADGYIMMTDATKENDSFVIADAVKLVYLDTQEGNSKRVSRKIAQSRSQVRVIKTSQTVRGLLVSKARSRRKSRRRSSPRARRSVKV